MVIPNIRNRFKEVPGLYDQLLELVEAMKNINKDNFKKNPDMTGVDMITTNISATSVTIGGFEIGAGEAENLDGLDQNVGTTDDVIFNDVTITTPSNIYDLSHDGFADFVANEHIDWTNATQNLVTTGTGNVGDLTCDALVQDGTFKLGDGGSTDYISGTATGVLRLVGGARVLRDLWIDAAGIKAPGAKPATAIAHGALETPAWQFGDEGVEGNEETVSFSFKVPNDMDKTVSPTISVGWSTNDTNENTCEWQLAYLWTSAGEDTSAAAQETLYADDAAPAQANGLVITTFIGIDAPSATDVCLHAQLKRLSSASAGNQTDDIADDVELHGICMQYTSNKLGTST